MYNKNFHTHTKYCDGKNTAEEMIEAAIDLGFSAIGFSGHSFTDFDDSYCMTLEETQTYFQEINGLKQKYADKIRVYCGTEQDYYSPAVSLSYDYFIGSVHYIYAGGKYWPVDSSAALQQECADECFGGDLIAYAEKYFELEADVIRKTGADFIGHFDLVSKFNEGDCLYDSHNPRYVKAWQKAALALCESGKPFEINTGAMARDLRTDPYPTLEMAQFITAHGGKLFLSSDCHYREKLAYAFEETEKDYAKFGLIDFEDCIKK